MSIDVLRDRNTDQPFFMKLIGSQPPNTLPIVDNVYANAGFIGTTIHRSYGTTRKADLSIISNSPLVATINAFLNTPMLGGMMSDGTTKMVKVQGYKSQLQKEANSDGTNNYTISLPLGSSLVTFKVDKTTDTEILGFANTLPLEAIAKLIQ